MRVGRRAWGALLLCAALIAVIFATGALRSQRVWANIELDGIGSQGALRLADGDAYGETGGGPYIDLPAGTYRLRWRLGGDGENVIRLSCSNDAGIFPSEIRTVAGEWEGEARFELTEAAHNLSIHIQFCSGTWMELQNLRLYSPAYTDGAWAAACLLLGGWLLALLWRRARHEEGRQAIALLALAVLFASIPALRRDVVFATDTQFHAARIMNLADGLRGGQLPVRVGGFSYNGYGAATSVFYPDLLLYPLALMVLGGASITFVLQLFTVAVNALTAALAYAGARGIFREGRTALCASILYVCSVYRLERLYDNFMAGQLLAMAFLPVFLLGLWEVFFGRSRRWPLLFAGATLVFQSHMLTTLLCAGTAACALLLFARRLRRERRLGALLKAVAATALVNLGTLAPMLTCYLSGMNSGVEQFGFAGSALGLHEVLLPGGPVGLGMLLGTALLPGRAGAPGEEGRLAAARLCAAAGALAVLLSTRLFPWSYAVRLCGFVEVLQFPWRFLTLGTAFLALCGGYGLARALPGPRAAILALTVSILCAAPYVQEVVERRDVMEFGQGVNPYMVYPEYQLEGTDVEKTRTRDVLTEGDVRVEDYQKSGTRVTARVEARTDAAVSLPLFGFDGYRAEVNGQPVAWRLGENNRLTVMLPAGTSGTLRVRYAGRTLWRVCDAISLATLLGMLAVCVRKRARRPAQYDGK